MLFLVFQLGGDRYAIEACQVIEVLPLVNIKRLPHAPTGVAGVFDYHGRPVPLIDLSELAFGTPSRKWMSTRILLVSYKGALGGTGVFGLLAEQATEAIRRDEEDFTDAGVLVAHAPYLGAVTSHAGSIIQRIEVQNLLSGNLRDLLHGERIGQA